jgi:hypothetical protein
VIDDGNASPRFLRLTVNQVPNTKELSKRIAIPLAAVIQVHTDTSKNKLHNS